MKDFKYTTLLLSLAVILATGCGSTDEIVDELNNTIENTNNNLTSCVEIDTVIDKDTLWSQNCYKVTRGITVNENRLLTIKEGVTLSFSKNAYLLIKGGLKAVGTATQPITFTGTGKSVGYWQGIRFDDSVDERNELNNVVLEYGGSWYYGGLSTSGSTILKIKNSTVRKNKLDGFYFSDDTKLTEFSNVTSTENEKTAGSIPPRLLGMIGEENDFQGNRDNYLTVRSGEIDSTQEWSRLNVPILVDNSITINENKLLTINAGARFEFKKGGYLAVKGALKAIGVAEKIDVDTGDIIPAQPIIFSASTKSAGEWAGIRFDNAVDDRNELANIILEYAGSWYYGALYTSDATHLKIRDSIIRKNKLNGFHFSDETKLSEFKNITSTENEKTAGSVHPNHLGIIDGSSNFKGNTDEFLTVRSGRVTSTQTWTPLSVPALVNNVTVKSGKLLTIKAGARYEFTKSGYISVEGALKAVGTVKNPILFTGATKSKGFWGGIRFNNAVDNRNELSHITLEYAGAWYYGAIYASDSTILNLHDSLIQNNKLFGLWIDGSAKVTTKNNTFINNDDGDIHQD
jgi:parallel beta-helix repeat protein